MLLALRVAVPRRPSLLATAKQGSVLAMGSAAVGHDTLFLSLSESLPPGLSPHVKMNFPSSALDKGLFYRCRCQFESTYRSDNSIV